MFACEFIKNEISLPLRDGYSVYEIEGLGPVSSTISSSQNIGYDGIHVFNAKVESRNLSIKLAITKEPEELRQKLFSFLIPKEYSRFHFMGETRDVYIDGVVESVDINYFGNPMTVQVVLLCPDPYWKDNSEHLYEMESITPRFEFEFSNAKGSKFEFGTKSTIQEFPIYNGGEIETGVTITMSANGTVKNPKIFNTTNSQVGEYMGLDFTLQTGDEVIITTNIGSKRITLHRGTSKINLFNYKKEGSTWLKLYKGDNKFFYECDEGLEFLEVKVEYIPEYIGV